MKANILVGIALIIFGTLLVANVISLATLIIDAQPPYFTSSTPFDKTSGYVPVSFLTGRKYSCQVIDTTSGVASVTYTDPQVDLAWGVAPLTRISGTANDGVWEASFPVAAAYQIITDYAFTFTATDANGNVKTLTGTFRIYSAIQGDWFVNDVKVTSPTQQIPLKTNSITFKFVKSMGIDDSLITCTATYGSTTRTLPKTAAGTWTYTDTMADGNYNVQLKAYDGTNSIVLSIYSLQVGLTGWTLPVTTGQTLGAVSIVAGSLVMLLPKLKHKK